MLFLETPTLHALAQPAVSVLELELAHLLAHRRQMDALKQFKEALGQLVLASAWLVVKSL